MTKSLLTWFAAGWLCVSVPCAAIAAPPSAALNPAGIASQETVMKLPRCSKQRNTQCRVVQNGTWIAVGGLGLATLAVVAAASGGGRSASP